MIVALNKFPTGHPLPARLLRMIEPVQDPGRSRRNVFLRHKIQLAGKHAAKHGHFHRDHRQTRRQEFVDRQSPTFFAGQAQTHSSPGY